jgi:hypothetical protein
MTTEGTLWLGDQKSPCEDLKKIGETDTDGFGMFEDNRQM